MPFVAIGLQRLLSLASVGDGLLPSHWVGHALALLGPAVGDVVILLGRKHGPHDRQPLVDVLIDGSRVHLHTDVFDLAISPSHRGLGAVGDGDDRSASARTALSGHGEDIHVRRDAHIAHGALPGGGHAITLGTLIHHGDVLEDDVAVGALLDTTLGSGEKFGIGNAAATSLIGRLGGEDAQSDIFILRSGQEERVAIPVPAADDFARRLRVPDAAEGRLAKKFGELLFQVLGVIGDGLLVILDLLVACLGLRLVLYVLCAD